MGAASRAVKRQMTTNPLGTGCCRPARSVHRPRSTRSESSTNSGPDSIFDAIEVESLVLLNEPAEWQLPGGVRS